MRVSMGNASLSQFVQEWHSLRFYIAMHWIEMSRDVRLHIETRSPVIRLSRGNVARIGHFLPANNSSVLLSRVIVFVHIIIFCVFDRVYILFGFYIGLLSDILRCELYDGQTQNEASFLVAICARCHAQSRDHARRIEKSHDVHYICKWVTPNSAVSCWSLQVFSSLYQFHPAIIY